MSRIIDGTGKIIDTAQDLESLVVTGKAMAIAGTGFLVAKNWRVGIPYAMRLTYLVAKNRIVSEINLVKDVVKLTRSTYFRSNSKPQVKKPPTPVKGRPISSRPLKPGRPGGGLGGINPVFTWGGLVLGTLIYADQELGFLEETDPITGDVPVA